MKFEHPVLPKVFGTVADAEVILGMPRTAIYKLVLDHPELLIQFDGRSLIDIELAAAIVREMPRGPRRCPVAVNRKGRKRRT